MVPEVWGPRLIDALYSKPGVAQRVLNVSADVKSVGDIAHIAVDTRVTVNDVSSDGTVAPQANTLTDISLTVNKWKEVTEEWTEITVAQAYAIWRDRFPVRAGEGIREKIDNDIMTLVRSDWTSNAAEGDGTGNVGEDELIGAIGKLLGNRIPVLAQPDDCTFVFRADDQYKPIKKLGILDYDRTGVAGQGGAAMAGVPRIYGVPVIFTQEVESSSSVHYNALFHKSAGAWALQKDINFREADGLAGRKLTKILNANALYGFKNTVAARAVQIKTKDV